MKIASEPPTHGSDDRPMYLGQLIVSFLDTQLACGDPSACQMAILAEAQHDAARYRTFSQAENTDTISRTEIRMVQLFEREWMEAYTNKPTATPTNGCDGDESTYTVHKNATFDHPPTTTDERGKSDAHNHSGTS
jgi:hypothetical protein